MDMNAMQNFAANRLGGSTVWQDAIKPALNMPDFGAMPDAASIQQVNTLTSTPAEPAPEVSPAQKRYRELVEAGTIDENGLAKNGKMFRGPEARLFVAKNGGREFVMKDKDLVKELNRITIDENRRLGGLEPLEEPQQQAQPQAVQDAQKTYFEKFFGFAPRDKSEEGFSAMIDASVDKNGKIDSKMMDTIQSYKDPTKSNMGLKELQLKDKRAKAEEAQRQRIADAKEQAERGIAYVNKLLNNLDNGVLPETGMAGLGLSYIPGTDAYTFASDLDTLKGMIAYGGLLGAKAGSPNGASGFGALSEKELSLLQNLLGNLKQGLSKEDLKNNLADIARYFRRSITPRELTDAELDAGVKSDSIQQAPANGTRKPLDAFRR